jgi:hypothetical protein
MPWCGCEPQDLSLKFEIWNFKLRVLDTLYHSRLGSDLPAGTQAGSLRYSDSKISFAGMLNYAE